jgi:ATP-dependent Clp protease ATP-binding subunit ClpA
LIAQASPEPEVLPIRTSSEIESSCRIKAKEIAAETYRGCVTEQKNSQIEQIKKEYAAKLQALKAHYEQELKKMNASSKSKAEDSSAPEAAPIEKIEKSEKSDTSASGKSPMKKQKVAVAPPASKKASKKAAVKIEKVEATEMTIQLKQAPGTPSADESTMDLPEPVPVEESPVSESSI